MRQPDNLPAFRRVHRNGRPLIGNVACLPGLSRGRRRLGSEEVGSRGALLAGIKPSAPRAPEATGGRAVIWPTAVS
jgi:hypothetical protein